MADNNKVTIDAAWFAELYATAKDKCQYSEAVINIAKERDELKTKLAYREDELKRTYGELKEVKDSLAKITKDCVQYERVCESLQASKKIIEDERADKLKVINELNQVRELNRKCCDENETLKAKLDCADVDRETYKDRAEAAERCIEDVWNCLSPQEIADNEYAHIAIIRAYREQNEAK